MPFQLLQLSTRHALRSFWPFRFLINFISIAQRSAGRLIAVLVLAEPGADLSLQIWGELGAGRRENRLVPVEGNPSPTGQIQSDSAVRSSRDRAGGTSAAEVGEILGVQPTRGLLQGFGGGGLRGSPGELSPGRLRCAACPCSREQPSVWPQSHPTVP